MLRNIFKELKTTAGALVILAVWIVPMIFHVDVPVNVQTALIAILGAILGGLAMDPKK